jgi:hypothetical protein
MQNEDETNEALFIREHARENDSELDELKKESQNDSVGVREVHVKSKPRAKKHLLQHNYKGIFSLGHELNGPSFSPTRMAKVND